MSEKLKYLFVAEFDDGSFFHQTADDTSKINPLKSQFYDLLQTGKPIHRFSLVGSDNNKKVTVTVDLKTGVFYVNGVTVLLESDKLPALPERFELIFYRQWTNSMNVTFKTKTKEITNSDTIDRFCEYFIGWQCTIKGKNYKQKLAIS